MNAQSIIDTLTAARDEALATAARCSEAIAVFVGASSQAAPARKPKPTAKTKSPRASKKANAPKPTKKAPAKTTKAPSVPKTTKTTKKPKAVTDDEPIARRGHMPKVGVQQLYCATLRERQDATGKLKGEGYRRIGPGEPLTAGTYDVRPSGDEDNTCVVLWRAKAESPEAAA